MSVLIRRRFIAAALPMLAFGEPFSALPGELAKEKRT